MKTEFNIVFRPAAMTDLPQLQELALESYGVFNSVLTSENWNKMREGLSKENFIAQLLLNASAFAASHNGKIVGMAFLTPSGFPNPLYEPNWSVIRMLGVHPAYTGRGIAKGLTQLCIDRARKNGEKIIGLHTSPEIMKNAIRIYEKAGFKFYKDIDPIFGVKYQLYKLSLE